jgi:titin
MVLAVAAVLVCWSGPAGASTTVFFVTNTADSGTGSLRVAIEAANANPGTDSIKFGIPGSGVQTIAVTSAALPAISDPVVVDGRTQPGYAGVPLIRLDNATGNSTIAGLDVVAGLSKVTGLSITGFGVGVVLETGDGNTLAGNWIGLDPAGVADGNTSAGVIVQQGSSGNLIGAGSLASRNVISGNSNAGIAIGGGAGDRNSVLGNFIGTDPTGSSARPNGMGIALTAAPGNTIGGTTAAARNVISGNTTDGVALSGSGTTGNILQGNYIGVDASGGIALANGHYGISVGGGANANQLGRGRAGGANVISGNGLSGVLLTDAGTSGNRVIANRIGTDAAGTNAVANANNGVSILGGATKNTVGGMKPAVRNVISGNTLSGVAISDVGTSKNIVSGNYIGTDASGSAALGNGQNGVVILAKASTNTVGGSLAGAGNVISGNAWNGVHISGLPPASGDTSQNRVAGNYIGTNAAGAAALGNGRDGVLIENTANNKVGGGDALARNVISGNTQSGVEIRGTGSTLNSVVGNYIGTDASGSAALGNTLYGVQVRAAAVGNVIGGVAPAPGNVISGNHLSGVGISGAGTASTLVAGNLIGTNAAATGAVPNLQQGVEVSFGAASTTIGGGAGRNIISGNLAAGILGTSGATGIHVEFNRIGTDGPGTSALPNGTDGVLLAGSSGNTVGGLSASKQNTIAFNTSAGLRVDGTSGPANGNKLLRNSVDHNGGLGIVLVAGGNNAQAAPVITKVTNDGVKTYVKGTLTSVASKTFQIDLFVSPSCDPSGSGEGATFLGSKTITTDVAGNAKYTIVVPLVAAGQALTTTATRSDTGDTSQFSGCAAS